MGNAYAQTPPPSASVSLRQQTVDLEVPPRELGLGALELFTGMAVAVVGLGGVVAIADWEDGVALAGTSLLALPALQGLAVCGVGKLSQDYDGSCLWPIGGAYLGAVALFPVALAGRGASQGPLEGALTVVVGLGLGVLIGAPIGATWAWNASKEWQRPESSGASQSSRVGSNAIWPRTAAPPRTFELALPSARIAPPLVFPLLAIEF
jgi:hypothetical protein